MALRVTIDVQDIEVENVFNNSNQWLNISDKSNFNLLDHGIEYFHFIIMNNSNVLPRKQSHGDPTMHEPQSGVLNVHVTRLKFSNYVLPQNFSPKLMMIKTFKSMI